MTIGEIEVIAGAIILATATLTAAVLFARKIDRDEPDPTVVRSYKDEYRQGGL
jgi:hypothetical protein